MTSGQGISSWEEISFFCRLDHSLLTPSEDEATIRNDLLSPFIDPISPNLSIELMATDKILLITGNDLRHRYFVNHLNHHFPLTGVFIEHLQYPEPPPMSEPEREAWEWFFQRRDAFEQQVFGPSENLKPQNQPEIFNIPEGELNTPQWVKKIRHLHPELIVLFGGSLIGDEILNQYPDRILNLHIGITGEYRGSSCNFWPIHDGRLDCLGTTLIRINQGIDTGEILAQGSIIIEETDNEQSMMAKTIVLGVTLTIEAIKKLKRGNLSALDLKRNGSLFLRKDFNPEAVLKVKTMIETLELESKVKSYSKSQGNRAIRRGRVSGD